MYVGSHWTSKFGVHFVQLDGSALSSLGILLLDVSPAFLLDRTVRSWSRKKNIMLTFFCAHFRVGAQSALVYDRSMSALYRVEADGVADT